MNRLVTIALGATLVFAAACGDDEVDDDTDAAVTIDASTVDAAPEPTLAEICDEDGGLYVEYFGLIFGCQSELFELFIGGPLPDAAELSALCEGALGPFIDDGTAILGDRDAFDSCRDFLDNLTCEDASFSAPNGCDDVIVGQVDLDGDCDDGSQCAGDAYCDGGSNVTAIQAMEEKITGTKRVPTAGPATCGTCTATKANGAVCQDDGECSSGYCKDIDMADDECARIGDVGDACDSSNDCIGTRVCDPVSSLCANEPTWAIDTPCSTFLFDCGPVTGTLMCHPGTLVCTDWLEVNDACDPGMGAAQFCRLFENETCADIGGGVFQCVAPTIVAEGASCGFTTSFQCGTGLVCDNDTAECVPQVGLGGDCSGTAQCEFFQNCVADECSYSAHTGMCPAP